MELQMMSSHNADNSSTDSSPPLPCSFALSSLSPQDIRHMIYHIPQQKQIELLQTSALKNPDLLIQICDAADRDVALRKLFIRCLSPETTSETLNTVFSFFGIIQEAAVISDEVTGRSKCYGFITFKHVHSAILAMKNPSRKIDGRMIVIQFASVGVFDNNQRKIFVENVPFQISSDDLLNYFLKYGEVEEGPIAFDKDSGKKEKGFAFFVYKTEEAAQAAVCAPVKHINGHKVRCRMAVDNKKRNLAQATTSVDAAASSGYSGDTMSCHTLYQQQPYFPFGGMYRTWWSPIGNSVGVGSSTSGGFEHGIGGYFHDYGERCPPSPSSAAATGSQGGTQHHQQQFMVAPGPLLSRGMYYVGYPYF